MLFKAVSTGKKRKKDLSQIAERYRKENPEVVKCVMWKPEEEKMEKIFAPYFGQKLKSPEDSLFANGLTSIGTAQDLLRHLHLRMWQKEIKGRSEAFGFLGHCHSKQERETRFYGIMYQKEGQYVFWNMFMGGGLHLHRSVMRGFGRR